MNFSKSFGERELPHDWQDDITPVHKKGEKEFASNYRRISLTSIVCKVMESIIMMVDGILAYIVSKKRLTNLQHRFVPRKSCQSKLLLMLHFPTESIENGTHADLVYLDFAKAFDTQPHKK